MKKGYNLAVLDMLLCYLYSIVRSMVSYITMVTSITMVIGNIIGHAKTVSSSVVWLSW